MFEIGLHFGTQTKYIGTYVKSKPIIVAQKYFSVTFYCKIVQGPETPTDLHGYIFFIMGSDPKMSKYFKYVYIIIHGNLNNCQ